MPARADIDAFVSEALVPDHNVAFAFLFGSYAAERQRQSSDLDLAVYFHTPPEGLAILDLRSYWSNRLGVEVDLVILNQASAFLRHQVMKTGKKLVLNDPLCYHRFRERTIADYQDYRWLSGRNAA